MANDFEYYSTKEFERVNAVIDKNATNLNVIKERLAVISEKHEALKTRMDNLDKNVNKLVWFVLLAVGGAVLKLVIDVKGLG